MEGKGANSGEKKKKKEELSHNLMSRVYNAMPGGSTPLSVTSTGGRKTGNTAKEGEPKRRRGVSSHPLSWLGETEDDPRRVVKKKGFRAGAVENGIRGQKKGEGSKHAATLMLVPGCRGKQKMKRKEKGRRKQHGPARTSGRNLVSFSQSESAGLSPQGNKGIRKKALPRHLRTSEKSKRGLVKRK